MKTSLIKYVALALLIYMPIFGHLDGLAIRLWDESRLAMNACEMLDNGNFIVTYYGGEPDMWNTKPPLLIWFQVFFLKLIGINEVAIRLPSAFAAFFTCLGLLVFSIRYLKSFWLGAIAVMVLITSQGYIELHGTRTGDYDSLLTMFTTLSCLLFFAYSQTKNNRYLQLFFLTTTLAVLTKSIAGLLFAPGLLIYCLATKEFVPLLKNKHFYIGAASFLVVVFGYYFLREMLNPGYIQAVYDNELGGRYLATIENHKHDNYFYYNNFINSKLSYWCLFIGGGFLIGIFNKDERIKKASIFLSIMIFSFFTIISTAQTKLFWYDLPLYPFLAMFGAISICWITDFLKNFSWANQTLSYNILPAFFLLLVFSTPYQEIIDKTYLPKDPSWDNTYEFSYYLRDAIHNKYNVDKQVLLYNGYHAHYNFYVYALNKKGIDVSFKDWNKDQSRKTVVIQQPNLKKLIETKYKCDIIGRVGDVRTYKIYDKK